MNRLLFFFRIMCLELALAPAIALSSAIGLSDETPDAPIPETVRDQIFKMYDAASECMKRCSPAYASVRHEKNHLMMHFDLPLGRPKIIEVFSINDDILMHVRASSMRWVTVVNCFVQGEYKPPSGWQTTRTLTREAAIERAKEYLKVFKIDVPADYKLAEANFGEGPEGHSCWRILWCRCSGQYFWDCDNSLGSETVMVSFYEKEGLAGWSSHGCNCPAPKRLEVRITKEEAIAKATRCVPLVQRSKVYHSSMRDGFVAKSVKSCELRVSAPNWWFDPKRCTYMSVGQARTETRLCWKIKLETMDSKQEERRRKGQLGPQDSLIAPEMTIYIDAATGEAVGADVM